MVIGGNLLASGEQQQISVEQTCEALEIAQRIGAKASLHTLGVLTPDLYYEEAYENAMNSLKKIAGTAEKTGVALAVEFVWNGVLFSPLEMKLLLDEVGSEAVGFYFDPGNMAIFQYPHHWIRTLGKYIKAMHMKDWEGKVDFVTLMAELRAAGYDGPMINEVEVVLAPIEKTAKTIKKIRTF